jgi:outer membrane murein-binding lipoprotein Lpp
MIDSTAQVIFDFGLLFVLTAHIYNAVSPKEMQRICASVIILAREVDTLETELEALREEVTALKAAEHNRANEEQLRAMMEKRGHANDIETVAYYNGATGNKYTSRR